MKPLRILELVHEKLVPPEKSLSSQERAEASFKTEYDIYHHLKKQGHTVKIVGVYDDLKVIKSAIEEFKPHIAFNLLEEFAGEAIYDQNVVSFLELMRVPYTGCNPRGLILARDKALTKEVLSYHRIKVPKFAVFRKFRPIKRPKDLEFPLIVKCLDEEASLGISQASVIDNDMKLKERVDFLHQSFGTDVIAEKFIGGREFYISIIGNERLKTYPIWELKFPEEMDSYQKLATRNVKFNENYREQNKITYKKAEGLTPQLESQLINTAKRVYRALKLSGYARIDLRTDLDGNIYVLEANPNPDIACDEVFAESAEIQGDRYGHLLNRIISLGMNWQTGMNI